MLEQLQSARRETVASSAGKIHDLAQGLSVLNCGEVFSSAVSEHRMSRDMTHGSISAFDELGQKEEA